MNEPLLEPGALFAGKYRVEAILGKGGMGVVLGARHTRLDEPVAIKVLLPAMMDNPSVVKRFLREARAASKIKSEHVARVTDVDTLPSGLPFIVMERLEGVDLAALCRQKREIEVEDAVRYVVEACEAVAEAHARGIVHRDIKPGNLFLAQRPDGSTTIKVLDFGISKLPADDGEHVVTAAGATLGSPSYMSPEQMQSARDVDARTDIWALGAVLFRLLTGRAPFRADSILDLYALVTCATVQRPRELRPDIPPGLDDVLVRCLEKDPTQRYGSVTELAAALLPFAGEGARLPAIPSSVRAPTLHDQPGRPEDRPLVPSSRPRSVEHRPAKEITETTASEGQAAHETSDPTSLVTSAERARMEPETPAGTAISKHARVTRRTARAAALLGVVAIVAAATRVRLAHRAADSMRTTVAADAAAAPPNTVRLMATATPDAALSSSVDGGTSEPIVVPAPSATAVVSAAPPKPTERPRPHERVEKTKVASPNIPRRDPFGGGRK